MTQRSLPWSDDNVGDGVLSPYDNAEWSETWRVLFQRDRTAQGYIEGYENQLEVTNPSGNTIRVATGAALVDGKFYETDADVDNAIATPAGSTRVDRIVLRKSWAAQTVRITVITGIEGAGAPSITQIDGTTWDVPLAQVSITTGAVITITDEREASRTPLATEATSALVKIETIVADGLSSTIDFTSIPSSYTNLLLVGQVRFAGAINEADLEIRFNNDSGGNYDDQQTIGENLTPSAVAVTGQNEGNLGQVPAGNAAAGYAGAFQMHINNYSDTNFYKNWLGMCINIRNATVADFSLRHIGGLWQDTSIINRITILSTTGSAGNIAAGSKVTLYGIS